MEFKIGDHIILKEESVYFRLNGTSGSWVKEVVKMDVNGTHYAKNGFNYTEEMSYFKIKQYRLATEKEILKSKLTTIFSK